MSLLQGDGFDHYPTALLSSKWDYVSDVIGLSADYSRFTDDARLQGLAENAQFLIVGQGAVGKNLPATNTGWGFFGIGFRIPTMPSQGYWVPTHVYDIASSGGMKLCALVGADGSLNIGYITTSNFSTTVNILATGPTGQVVANTYYTIEVGFKINSTTGGCIVSLNGATSGDRYLTYSGNTVRSTGSNHFADSSTERFTHVRLGGGVGQAGSNVTAHIDDYYYCDDTDTAGDGLTNTFLRRFRLGIIMPNGAGDSDDFTPFGATPSWNCVKELSPDDLTTYARADTPAQELLMNYENIPASVTRVYGLLMNARAAKDDAEIRTYAHRIKPSGSSASSVVTRDAPSNFTNQQDPVELNPATSARFTAAQVNSSQYGMRVVA